jgi:hypothetical protein
LGFFGFTKKKAATFNPYFSLGLQMVISSSFLSSLLELAPLSITSIPAISWWAIAYLVIIGSVLALLHLST